MINNLVVYPVILILVFMACSHTSEIISSEPTGERYSADYAVFYYIHADGDYLFHDSEGNPVQADQRALAAAIRVAENAQSGEVFIFHQRPQKRFLHLFPRRSSALYYYRNGDEVSRVKYRHAEKDEDFLDTERELFERYNSEKDAKARQKYLLFFGHEIPAEDGYKYHQTLPGVNVTAESFAAGIQGFLDGERDKFELVVLSACSNGTPAMAKHLLPAADYLLASPQNLHLSHIDSDSLHLLETNRDKPPPEIAGAMAEQTYNRLAESIQTTITFTIYDLDTVRDYIEELYARNSEYEMENRPDPYRENIDCGELPFFNLQKYNRGLESWYRPPRFGRQAGRGSHSGWGCKGL